MARLKTKEQLEQERLEFVRRISGNYPLPTDRQALLYVRQSSTKQVFDKDLQWLAANGRHD